MNEEFWITTIAIVIGPILAVLISQFLLKHGEQRQRRLFIFRSLMSTRRTPLSPERVQALNLVEVEFYGQKKVIAKFQELLKVYSDQVRWKSADETVQRALLQEVDDLTAQLLAEIGASLGYKLENLELLRGGYYPEAFTHLENQQAEIREFLVGLNNGQKALPIMLVDARYPKENLQYARDGRDIIKAAEVSEESGQTGNNA
ncbi:DUF6680 family protein [Rhodosalinus sp. FB01]|uniref:DUF6680 family protein n=1 Tax=Rhodosalinus sp. FB01 TaxID=3239194 RepID=UPI0035259EBE